MMKKKIAAVAMSGGVDSSVACALLIEQGYKVIGITMSLFSIVQKENNFKNFWGNGAIEDSRCIATFLKIPHHVIDLKKQFEKVVIQNFCDEYSKGCTPNPCIRCNRHIKFDLLMRKAMELGAEHLATGHYAKVLWDPQSKHYLLKKATNKQKDQSYFLYSLSQEQLSRTLLPIGSLSKTEVKKKALKMGLPIAHRPESQEICFIPDNNYSSFLHEKIPGAFRPGYILDINNRIVGKHKGIINFTIGQRKGIGIAAQHPLYVLEIRSNENSIVVGTNEDLYKNKLIASHIHIISESQITEPVSVKAKIRYKHKEAKARIFPEESNLFRVEFEKLQRAITPGQAVVFYDGDLVIGGGTIIGPLK